MIGSVMQRVENTRRSVTASGATMVGVDMPEHDVRLMACESEPGLNLAKVDFTEFVECMVRWARNGEVRLYGVPVRVVGASTTRLRVRLP